MDGNGLGKLLPKSIAAKRRRKKQSTSGDGSGDESLRGRSIGSRETTESDGTGSLDAPDEEETSLISFESDHDSPATRPTTIISTHPSQIGYLTTNSPLVQADHLQEVQKSEQQESAAPFPDLPKDPSQSARPLSASSSTGLVPPRPQSRRSPSPVGRFKEVFKPRKGSTSTASSSPERGAPRERSHSELPAREVDSSHRLPDVSALPKSNSTPDNAKVASTERFRRLSRGQKIDTTTPPRTPPTGDQATPVIVNTPPTPTDSSHPERKAVSSRDASPEASRRGAQTNASGSPQGNMISQRRARSGSGNIGPSKLSNITLAPLTPTPENGPNTPSSAGFFSSMLSAAQNATNTLSNTITNTNITSWNNGTKKTASTTRLQEGASDDNIEVEPATEVSSEHPMESKELAVNTLGKGDLSLSQLGIPEPSSSTATPTTAKFQDSAEARGRSESAPAENNYSYVSAPDSVSEDSRPRSLYDTAAPGDRTTPSSSIYEGKSGVQRSGSIRSAIGRHRKRGSSITTGGTTATGGTIAAAILAANASVAHPSAQASTPKLTGFAVANKKRNRDFHALFKSVPDDDYLIEDYGCALQRDILAHGRLYISEGHLCFSSNILGWQTTLVLSFDEIISVEKRSTALVFKNGLMISTLHVKHIFASFMSRDSVYDLIVKIWKLGHPSLQSSLNGVRIDETGGDKTEKVDIDGSIGSRSITSASDDDSEEEDDVYDEDEENDEDFETTQMTDPGLADNDGEKAVSRKPSGAVATNGMSPDKSKDAPAGAAAAGGDFPGPATHAPTECGDSGTHYDKFLADEVIPAPLGKVYSLMFGPASASFMSKWLTNEQKCTDVQMEDQKGLSQDNKTHTYTYIKPLYGAIGPKSTKCIITETIENIDLEKAVNVNCTTQTPEVPSGNVFSVKTKYCLSWAENNGTRVQANCTVEWTGKSWIKGTIEKAANEGQVQYCKDIFAALRGATSARPRVNTFTNGAGGKGKKKRKGKSTLASSPTSDTEGTARAPKTPDWGVLEPLHGILGPIVDIIGPLMTGNVVYGLLVGLLVASWFGFGFTNRRSPGGFGHDIGYYAYPDRLAAYDEIWRREESELWDWLEERVGMDRLGDGAPPVRKRAVEPRTVEEKIREDRMDDREIKEAIRVTEEKLKVLKSVVHKKGGPQAAEESGSANEHKHSVASS